MRQTCVQGTGCDTGVAKHERVDSADSLRAAVVFRHEVESLRERSLHLFFLKRGTRAPDRIGDFVGDKPPRLAEPRGGHDMRVNPLLGFLQVEFALDLPTLGLATRAAARISRSLRRGLFIDLDEAGRRFGEASVVGLECSQNTADRPVALSPPLQRGRDVAARFDDDRDDDVAEALALRLPRPG